MRDSDIDTLSADGAQECQHPIEARRTNVGQVEQVYEVCSACETRLPIHPADSAEALLRDDARKRLYARAAYGTVDKDFVADLDAAFVQASAPSPDEDEHDAALAQGDVTGNYAESSPAPAAEPIICDKCHHSIDLHRADGTGRDKCAWRWCSCRRTQWYLQKKADRAAAEGDE